jgi:hypothetical protein
VARLAQCGADRIANVRIVLYEKNAQSQRHLGSSEATPARWHGLAERTGGARYRSVTALLCAVSVLPVASAAFADDTVAGGRPPMPEAVFTETVTDIDGSEAGELEVEVSASRMRATMGMAATMQGSAEVEWLVTRRLGVRFETAYARSTFDTGADLRSGLGASGAASWKILQDFRDDFHLQAELGARLPWDELTASALAVQAVSPGEPALPLTLDLRSALRAGWLVVRGGVGVEAGGTSAHAPARASVALLSGFGLSDRFGFWGFELDADGARSTPALLAFDLVPNLSPLGIPFRLALAIPWAPGAPATQPSLGIFIRLFVESARESDYGHAGLAAPRAP